MLTNVYLISLLTTAIIALVYKSKFGKPPFGYFPYYLLFLFFVELGGFIITKTPMRYNGWWYNILINGEYLYLFYLYYSLIKNNKVKNILLILGGIYIMFYFIHYIFLTSSWNKAQSFPFAYGNTVLIFAIFWYLVEFFKSDEVLKLFEYLIIWISIGLLIYLIVSLPVMIARYYLIIDYEANDLGLMKLMGRMQRYTNMLMYIIYITGILRSSKSFK